VVPLRKQMTVVKFSPSGDRLFAGGSEGQIGTVHFATSELQMFNGEHDGRVKWMEISADGQRLATASADGTARLWDVRMGSPESRVLTNGSTVWDARFGPDSTWFVMAGVDGVEIRDTSTGALRHRLPLKGLIAHLDVSPDGRRVVACSNSGESRVWDA